MPISGQSFPCVVSKSRSLLPSLMYPEQVSKDPAQKPNVDLVVVRENTECLVCLPHVLRDSPARWRKY